MAKTTKHYEVGISPSASYHILGINRAGKTATRLNLEERHPRTQMTFVTCNTNGKFAGQRFH
jgi:hypothetical protein